MTTAAAAVAAGPSYINDGLLNGECFCGRNLSLCRLVGDGWPFTISIFPIT